MILTDRSHLVRSLVGIGLLLCATGPTRGDDSPLAPDGVVVDEAGQPVAGVSVELVFGRFEPVRTNAAGEYRILDGARARLSDLSVLARAEDGRLGFSPQTSKPTAPVRVTLKPARTVRVHVVDAQAKPVADAEVVSTASYGIITRGRTDPEGNPAPYQSGLILHSGQPLTDVDLTLGPATRLRGRVTTGTDGRPVPDLSIGVVIDKGGIPEELKRPGDRFYHALTSFEWVQTDTDGQYTIQLGPGEYEIRQVPRVDPIKFTIPAQDAPADLVRDIVMPRPDTGPFQLTVVTPDGRPAVRVKVSGTYASMNHHSFAPQRTNAAGQLTIQRVLDPMILEVMTDDKAQGAIVSFGIDATEGKIALQPTATASGRLTDPEGNIRAGTTLRYGLRVYSGPKRNSPFSTYFGGSNTTDTSGRFTCVGLVPGQSYEISVHIENDSYYHAVENAIQPTGPGPLDLGDVAINTTPPPPPKPYVPPTPTDLAREAFDGSKEKALDDRIKNILVEARREYTVPLVLLGDKEDPTCVDLFRLFNDQTDPVDAKGKAKTPADLRWDFELISLGVDQSEVKALASRLGVDPRAAPPVLIVLDDAGQPVANYPLRLGADQKLDGAALASFLLKHKLPTRDAPALLAKAQAECKADGKRTFLIFSASWCGPCRLPARFLNAHKSAFDPYFHFVKLDTSRDDGITALRARYPQGDQSGVPWFVILGPDGQPLANSNRLDPSKDDDQSNSNIGFPSDKEGIDHFLKMLRLSVPTMPADFLDSARGWLSKSS